MQDICVSVRAVGSVNWNVSNEAVTRARTSSGQKISPTLKEKRLTRGRVLGRAELREELQSDFEV
jgi:hypothetical protein